MATCKSFLFCVVYYLYVIVLVNICIRSSPFCSDNKANWNNRILFAKIAVVSQINEFSFVLDDEDFVAIYGSFILNVSCGTRGSYHSKCWESTHKSRRKSSKMNLCLNPVWEFGAFTSDLLIWNIGSEPYLHTKMKRWCVEGDKEVLQSTVTSTIRRNEFKLFELKWDADPVSYSSDLKKLRKR